MFRCCSKLCRLTSVKQLYSIGNETLGCSFYSSTTNKPSTTTKDARRGQTIKSNLTKLMEVPEETRVFVKLLDETGKFVGVMKKSEARNMAFRKEMTLFEVENAKEPADSADDGGLKMEKHKRKSSEDPPVFVRDLPVKYPSEEEIENLEVCQLMTQEQSRTFQKHKREQRKTERITKISGESLFRLSTDFKNEHVEAKLKQVKQALKKRKVVKITLTTTDDLPALETLETKVRAATKDNGSIDSLKSSGFVTDIVISPNSQEVNRRDDND